jgi:hypothetical protein
VPIETAKLSDEAVAAVRRALSASGRYPSRRGAALSLSSPHQVFGADLERLAAGDRLEDAARLVAWRALLEEDRQVVAAVELPAGEGKAGAIVNRGPFVESTVAALGAAEQDERVASARVELRLLRVDALYLLSLWLHASEAPDLFVPLQPAPTPFRAGTTYEHEPFERELSELARSVAAMYESAERPDELGS